MDKSIALSVGLLTVSDSRGPEEDTSGDYLAGALSEAGHVLAERLISRDDIYQIRAIVSRWIAETKIETIICTGGTGFSGRDSTPEAVSPLFDKLIDGFGELFRQLSLEEIGSSTIQSRATAGIANDTLIFCLPGSTGACRLAWEKILATQLDSRHKPCNFANVVRFRAQAQTTAHTE